MRSNFVVLLLCAAACTLLQSVSAIYEKNKGKDEWIKKMIGEIEDLVFIDKSEAYVVSTDGLIGLNHFYNTEFVWKKQLPLDIGEVYKLRHVGRNVLAISNLRVIMMNSVGHVIFEMPLEGDVNSKAVVEMFQLEVGGVQSVIVKDDQVEIFKDYLNTASFKITEDIIGLPEDFYEVLQPLELIHNKENNQLLLVAKTGVSAHTESTRVHLSTFLINIDAKSVKLVGSLEVEGFESTSRSKSLLVLIRGSGEQSEVIDPYTLETKLSVGSEELVHPQSISDDFTLYVRDDIV